MDNPNDNNSDTTDEGIFMKMHNTTESTVSIQSIFAPLPMSPTQNRSSIFVQTTNTPATPESPNYNSTPNKLRVQSEMKRITSTGNIQSNEQEAKVLVLYTGGTIGMIRNDKNGKSLLKIRSQ